MNVIGPSNLLDSSLSSRINMTSPSYACVSIRFVEKRRFFLWRNRPNWASTTPLLRFPYHTHTHTHTNHAGLLWTSDQLVTEAATYKTHNKHKRRTSMPSAGFELASPAIERSQMCALDSTANGIGVKGSHYQNEISIPCSCIVRVLQQLSITPQDLCLENKQSS